MHGNAVIRQHEKRLPIRRRRFTVSGRTELPSGLVTFMFTDIEGSTRLARMLGSDYGSDPGDHRSVMRTAFRDYGGVELFTEGDSFFVAFWDACAALAAGVEAQRRLSAHDWSHPDVAPKVRIGMHTGWAKPNGDEYASVEVHRAARVAAAAHGGQILCSGATAKISATTGQTAQGAAENHELLGVPLRQLRKKAATRTRKAAAGTTKPAGGTTKAAAGTTETAGGTTKAAAGTTETAGGTAKAAT